MSPDPKLSAILVCSEDDPRLPDALEGYLKGLQTLPCPCELIIVGSGSFYHHRDKILPILQGSGVPSTIADLPRFSDDSSPILAGVKVSRGEWIALLPPYLQTDPAELHRMVAELEGGADYVASWRYPRVDSRHTTWMSAAFNALTRFLTGVPLHDLNSGLRLLRRTALDQIPIYGDLHRYLPVLAAIQGFRVVEIKTRHLEERVRWGDYGFGVYLRRLLDLLTLFFLIKFTKKPLRFFGLLGSACFGLGSLITAVLVVQRLLGVPLGDRPLLVLGVTLAVLGIQLFSLGLLGELILFIHGKTLSECHVETVYETQRDPQ